MGDEGTGDYDLDDVLDWIYVEDDFPLADELAESQIPDPGYAGTKHELDMEELDDFDVFDYWDDLQYGDDSYWEYDGVAARSGTKRKRTASVPGREGDKRQRIRLVETGGDNVRFVNWTIRKAMAAKRGPLLHNRASFALFPDWKQRFANEDGVTWEKEMPAAMKMAAEGRHEDPPRRTPNFSSSMVVAEEDQEDDAEADGAADDMPVELPNLDPEMLKSILRQKLGDAGLKGMDENALMHMMHKMLSGEEDADELEENLTNSVLERATQGEDAALSGWLSQQGVSLDTSGDDNVDSVATPELPQVVDDLKRTENFKSSPSDSAIEMQKPASGASTELAIHPSSPSDSAKKRVASSQDFESVGSRKRKKVAFDMPSQSESVTVSQKNGETTPKEEHAEPSDPQRAEDPVPFDTTVDDDNIQVTITKTANAMAVKRKDTDKSDTTKSAVVATTSSANEDVDTGTISAEREDEIVVTPAPAKNTRKRKAEADKTPPKNPPKKQARKGSGPAEAAGRRTRSTRAATKAGK